MEKLTTFIRGWGITIGRLAMALALVSTLVAVRPARAEGPEHHGGRGREHEQRQYRRGHGHWRGRIYVPAPDVYYAPPPVVYGPPVGFNFIFPFRIR